LHCSYAGGWGDCGVAIDITATLRQAPKFAVPSCCLEAHLYGVYVGFFVLLIRIQRAASPQSVRQLRRDLTDRIAMFFWNNDL
jgi:hypothetical protein